MDRLVELTRYFPEYLKGYPEIQRTAEAEKKEIGRLYGAVDALWNNGYIQTADYAGIKRWEFLLGIKPYPGDSLEERRTSVLLKWNQELPYTLIRLRERLDAAIGEGTYMLDLRPWEYALDIQATDQTCRVLSEMRSMVREMIPANLVFLTIGKYPVDIPVCVDIDTQLEMISEFYARHNEKFLFLDGAWSLDGAWALDGYREAEPTELYPAALTIGGGIEVQEPKYESGLMVEKDLWCLDGAYALDGEKPLDAEVIEYEL